MPSISSSSFKTEPTKRKIQIILDNDEISYPQMKEIEGLFDCFSTPIHEGHGFSKDNLLRFDPPCTV
jgi:hypothetical protein